MTHEHGRKADRDALRRAVAEQPEEFDDSTKLRAIAALVEELSDRAMVRADLAPGIPAGEYLLGLADRLEAFAALTGEWPGWEPPLRHLRIFLDRARRLADDAEATGSPEYVAGVVWVAETAYQLLEDPTREPDDRP